jgi:methionine-rich copper-binding protein CopC
MPWLRYLTAGAAVAIAVTAAVLLADRPPDPGRVAVTSTTPADGAALARAPTEVELSFTGPVDPGRSHVSVLDGSDATSALNAGTLRQVAPDRLSQPLAATAGGELTVAYHVTFTDGAELAGSFRFTARSGNGSGGPTPTATHQHGIDPVSAGLLVVDGIVALTVGILLMRRPRSRAPNGS